MQFEQGPYIQMAGICEQVIEDKIGVLSLIRIIDTITHTEAHPDVPIEMPQVTYPMKMVIMLKSGRARGRHELKIVPQLPSGETKTPLVRSALSKVSLRLACLLKAKSLVEFSPDYFSLIVLDIIPEIG